MTAFEKMKAQTVLAMCEVKTETELNAVLEIYRFIMDKEQEVK